MGGAGPRICDAPWRAILVMTPGAAEAAASSGFQALDWSVVAGVLAVITIAGKLLAGRQSSMRDFFLGGRRLPWPAVSASIVATEISAVTYISLPSVVFREGGNITYLQLGLIGSFLARAIVGYVLVPAYFEREIYSPYDFMGARLGEKVRRATTVLFSLGGVLGQSARVYLTAVVLEVVLGPELGWIEARWGWDPLVTSVAAIGLVAIVWTWMGGIAAVVWTDVFLFGLFLVGIAVSLWSVHRGLDAGLGPALSSGLEAGKFRFLDFGVDPTAPYTFWVACIAAPWGMVGPYGTDQLIVQRLLCCKNARDARRAMLWSTSSILVTFLVALLGIGLWALYRESPLSGELAGMVAAEPDKVFPVFITTAIPAGLRGLVVAGAFAAAISSLDSILAALSQTTLSAFARKRKPVAGASEGPEPNSAPLSLFASRVSVLLWGVALCGVAVYMREVKEHYPSVLDLALAMAGYTGGALLAAFFLALIGRGASGLLWSAPLSVLAVFAVAWHGEAAGWVLAAGLALMGAGWLRWRCGNRTSGAAKPRGDLLLQSLVLILGGALVIGLWRFATFEGGKVLAYPWFTPLASLVAFVFALGLDRSAFSRGSLASR